MRRVRAKKLRNWARDASVGRPEIMETVDRNGATVLHPNCTRAIYQQLKKVYREARA